MEADWEVEIGGDAPVIDGAWSESIDLRTAPERVGEIAEAAAIPAMAAALVQLNGPDSPVYSTKCDVWIPDSVDPDELNAAPEDARTAIACYVDLLSSSRAWQQLSEVESFCRMAVACLHVSPVKRARADLVIRSAYLPSEDKAFGITAYLLGSGPERSSAETALGEALQAFADAVFGLSSAQSTIEPTGE